jgi:hypothetical protein
VNFKVEDKVTLKNRPFDFTENAGINKKQWSTCQKLGRLTVYKVHPRHWRERDFVKFKEDKTNFVWPAKYLEKVEEKMPDLPDIKVGDYVNIERPSQEWINANGTFSIMDMYWEKAKTTGPHLILKDHTEFSGEKKCLWIKFMGGSWYFPVRSMTKETFKLHDRVRYVASNYDWCGLIVKVDKDKSKPYKVVWENGSNHTWYAPSQIKLANLSLKEMKEMAKKNTIDDFRVRQIVTVIAGGSQDGSVTRITGISKIGGTIHTECNAPGCYWRGPEKLFIHKNTEVLAEDIKTSASLADTAVLKKEISLERKDDKVISFTKKSRKKTAKKKVAKKKISKKKTSSKTKTKRHGGYVVRALMRNGAAKKAGINVGDTITSVDGKRIEYRGALGSVLKNFKKGAKVSVTVVKPDGRKDFLRSVTLGGRKDGRATLGVIAGKKNASAYNAKVEKKAKSTASAALAFVNEAVADVPENEFMARARIEMEGAAALMADMKGRDALLKARNLKRDLKGELRKGMHKNTELVNTYLERLRNDATIEEAPKKSKRTLSRKGKFVLGFLSLAALTGSGLWITSLLGLI